MNPTECLREIFTFRFQVECIPLLISKLLGFSIICFSAILKVPQIMSMFKSKSDEGLSYLSMYVEIFLFVLTALYSYHKKMPFSTYGENIIILIQSLIILMLAWKYSKGKVRFLEKFTFLVLINCIIYVCLNDKLNKNMWDMVGSSTIPLLTVSRISQIYNSFITKSTGSLSIFTFTLSLLGCIARIFTTVTETNDMIALLMYIYAAFLNVVIIIQINVYGVKKEEKIKPE